jgi:hypothetical protein
MEKNACKVAVDVENRLDDAPVLKEFVKAHLTKPEDKQFFFNKDNLKQYLNAQSEQKKVSTWTWIHGDCEGVLRYALSDWRTVLRVLERKLYGQNRRALQMV